MINDYNSFILDRGDNEWPEPECPEDSYDYEVVVTAPNRDDWHLEPTPYVDGDPF